MKKSTLALLIFAALLCCSSCSSPYLNPEKLSKAVSPEGKQLEEMKRHNKEMERLMQEQNEILKTNHANNK